MRSRWRTLFRDLMAIMMRFAEMPLQHLDFILDAEREEEHMKLALHVNAREFVDCLDGIIIIVGV